VAKTDRITIVVNRMIFSTDVCFRQTMEEENRCNESNVSEWNFRLRNFCGLMTVCAPFQYLFSSLLSLMFPVVNNHCGDDQDAYEADAVELRTLFSMIVVLEKNHHRSLRWKTNRHFSHEVCGAIDFGEFLSNIPRVTKISKKCAFRLMLDCDFLSF
jgi:hypothetical protein